MVGGRRQQVADVSLLLFAWIAARSATAAFLYPGYASYKTLSQRPASEDELERWLMYWSVLGFVVSAEYFAEWIISWSVLYPDFIDIIMIHVLHC